MPVVECSGRPEASFISRRSADQFWPPLNNNSGFLCFCKVFCNDDAEHQDGPPTSCGLPCAVRATTTIRVLAGRPRTTTTSQATRDTEHMQHMGTQGRLQAATGGHERPQAARGGRGRPGAATGNGRPRPATGLGCPRAATGGYGPPRAATTALH